MPPKPKSPAKGKKGKLSKAEKERLKKEELERKEKEEEDARLKAEQEEKDRLERERLEREERERIEAAESQRYTAESQDLLTLLEGNRNALVTLLEDRKQKAQWHRFMKCDGSPDPTVNAEINTYINLWKEDESRNNLDAVLKESNQTLDLINELQQYLEAADNIDLTDGEVLRYEETIVELEDLLHAKQDAATFELLKVTLASRLLTFSLLKEMAILTSLVRLTSPFVSTVVRGPWALGTLHKPIHPLILLALFKYSLHVSTGIWTLSCCRGKSMFMCWHLTGVGLSHPSSFFQRMQKLFSFLNISVDSFHHIFYVRGKFVKSQNHATIVVLLHSSSVHAIMMPTVSLLCNCLCDGICSRVWFPPSKEEKV